MQVQSIALDTQPVQIWSSDHKTHGMIPPQLIDRAINYYRQKGDDHIADDFEMHKHNFTGIRHDRPKLQNRKTLLKDGQIVRVYTARNTEKLRVKLVRDSDRKSSDRSVDEAYDGASATYSLLKDVYKTKSIDGHSYPLENTVHYGRNYCNAFWNGQEMVFGDGDGKIFDRFTVSIDVTGHEIGHGVTEDQCGKLLSRNGKPTGVDYSGEAGGINEGLSDILGIQVKQRARKQTAEQSDWLIGEGLILGKNKKVYALRSMKTPGTGYVDHPRLGTDSQIGKYSEYVEAAKREEVDPHTSSGIVNKAFYETAMKLGGNTWERSGRIFFETLPSLGFKETFSGMANKTVATAQRIYGKGSAEESAVIGGWKTVEVNL